MAMTPAIAAARKYKKHKEAISMAAMLAALVALWALACWFEYQLLDVVEPWVRVAVISSAWLGAVGLFTHIMGRANKSHGVVARG